MKPACNELSISEAVRAIQDGSVTSESLVQACLDRIRERENSVGAWIHFDEEKALKQARKCDDGPVRGPLHGIPAASKISSIHAICLQLMAHRYMRGINLLATRLASPC